MKTTDKMVEAAITAHAKAKWKGGLVQDHWRAALSAALAAAEQPVAVKPLVWNKVEDDIYENRQWDYRLTFGGDKWGISPVDWPCFEYLYDSLDEAKAAAQQDFEARIRSALASPAQVSGPKIGDAAGPVSIMTRKETP